MDDVRRELAHRPLVLAAVGLAIGLTAVAHPLNLLFLALLLVARRPLPVALAFVAGLALAPRPAALLPEKTWMRGAGIVLDVPREAPDGLRASVEVGGLRLRALFPPETRVSKGETWRLEGNARPLSEVQEGDRLRGLSGNLNVVRSEKLADGAWPWRVADLWRRDYESFARRTLPAEQARWLGAFAFRGGGLEDEETEALKATGTIHLIAASGLHVGALAALTMLLGAGLGLPRRATLIGTFAALALFALATGLHLPTVRAALAFAAFSSAYLFRREPDGLSAIALAVLAYLPFDPAAVYDLGFQLSLAVVGMLILRPKRREAEPPRDALAVLRVWTKDLAAVSVIAALAAEPILAQRNGEITLLTVPANVLVVPPVMAAVLLSFLLYPLRFAFAMPIVGGLVAFAGHAVEWAGAIGPTALRVPPFSPYALLVPYGLWIGFWRPRARPC